MFKKLQSLNINCFDGNGMGGTGNDGGYGGGSGSSGGSSGGSGNGGGNTGNTGDTGKTGGYNGGSGTAQGTLSGGMNGGIGFSDTNADQAAAQAMGKDAYGQNAGADAQGAYDTLYGWQDEGYQNSIKDQVAETVASSLPGIASPAVEYGIKGLNQLSGAMHDANAPGQATAQAMGYQDAENDVSAAKGEFGGLLDMVPVVGTINSLAAIDNVTGNKGSTSTEQGAGGGDFSNPAQVSGVTGDVDPSKTAATTTPATTATDTTTDTGFELPTGIGNMTGMNGQPRGLLQLPKSLSKEDIRAHLNRAGLA